MHLLVLHSRCVQLRQLFSHVVVLCIFLVEILNKKRFLIFQFTDSTFKLLDLFQILSIPDLDSHSVLQLDIPLFHFVEMCCHSIQLSIQV